MAHGERMWRRFEEIRQDVRYAARTLRRSPGFTSVAIATLAVGIGAATAIYTVVDQILLQPLPFTDSDRMVRVRENVPRREPGLPPFSRGLTYPEFLEWRARTTTLSDVAATGGSMALVQTADGTSRLWGTTISGSAFASLGVRPILGRTLVASDDADPNVVLLGFEAWRRLFRSDPDVAGKTVRFLSSQNDGRVMTIVGVLPAYFELAIGEAEFYTPIAPEAAKASRFTLIGRVRPGLALADAVQEAQVIGSAITPQPRADAPPLTVPRFAVERLKDLAVLELRPALRVFLGTVAVVLLIVCANVANLLLARGTARQREMAVRFAIGASRGRVVRQVLTECLVLAAIGGAVGALLGAAGVMLVKELALVDAPGIFRLSLGASILPRVNEIGIDLKMFGIAFGAAALASLVFGVLPAVDLSRAHGLRALTPRGASSSRGTSRLRSALVVGQVVMATVLLVAAGLLVRSLDTLSKVGRGYDPSNVLAFQLVFPPTYSIARKVETIESVLARVRSMPGAEAAGFTRAGMLIGEQITLGTFVPQGRTLEEMSSQLARPSLRPVSPGFLTAMGVPVLEGRELDAADSGATPQIVISRSVARQFGPGSHVG
jgi:putative ABC transport system permease protein